MKDKEMTRGYVAEAIAAHGDLATPYLPELEKMLADGSAGGTLAEDVKRALSAIQNPKPEAKAEPTVKAVALVDTNQSQAAAPTATPAPSPPVPAATSLPSTPIAKAAERPATVVERKSPTWPWVVGVAALSMIALLVWKRRA